MLKDKHQPRNFQVDKSQLFVQAWRLAKTMAMFQGGSSKDHFSMALSATWKKMQRDVEKMRAWEAHRIAVLKKVSA